MVVAERLTGGWAIGGAAAVAPGWEDPRARRCCVTVGGVRVGGVAGVDLLEEYRRATMFFEAGDPGGAARLLEPIIVAEPENSAVRLLLARAYFSSAQLGRAEEQLRTLVEQDPSDHYAHHVLGRTLERQGRRPEALPHLRLAAAMRPDDYDYQSAVIRVENHIGRRS